jgi:hypothetical protein
MATEGSQLLQLSTCAASATFAALPTQCMMSFRCKSDVAHSGACCDATGQKQHLLIQKRTEKVQMEFLIGATVAGIVIFFVMVKSKTDKFNKLSRVYFPSWLVLYSNSQMPENIAMARALILQTFHLAAEFGAITALEKART